VLDQAAAFAKTRRAGDSQMLDRTGSDVDISPLVALTAAYWLLTETGVDSPTESAYEARGLEVV